MPAPSRGSALDHVVVLMFENRSFDHLLGRLYEPGEVESFEGVIGKELSNPVPAWPEHGAERGVVPYGIARDMNTPYPDPGEEYPHINTQLFGGIDPPSNRGVSTEQMVAPYNLPAEAGRLPTMDGFVADYISAFTAEMGRQPTCDEYSRIMTGYTPSRCRSSPRWRAGLRRSITGSPTCRRRRSPTARSFTPRAPPACSSTARM